MFEFAALPKMVIEVAVFAALLYLVLRFLRETRGSGVVRGLAFLLIVGLASFVVLIQAMQLDRLALLFQTIAQSVVIALVIVFHPEIRRAIVHLGDSPIFGRFFQKESKIVQRVLRAVARMGKERIGALIAIEREASLQSLAESGITIDAELNSFLIESIFYPKSALHDGAILVRDDRIVAASCLLPLSQNQDIDKRLGTRHRAALGLSEETDALAIVVSEETGKVSVALGGKLTYDLTLEQLERQMDESLGARLRRSSRRTDKSASRTLWATLVSDPVRKLAALALGVGLWVFLDRQIMADFELPMNLGVVALDERGAPRGSLGDQLSVGLPTDRVALRGFVDANTGQPTESVRITFRGPKNSIERLKTASPKLDVDLREIEWDKVESVDFTVTDIRGSNNELLEGAVTMAMEPTRVRIQIVRVAAVALQVSADQIELSYGGDDRLKTRIRDETYEFSPRVVHVVGSEQALQAFESRKGERPLRAQLVALQSERQLTATVALHPEFEKLGLKLREHCSLMVQLRPVMEVFELELPVLVDDSSLPVQLRGQYRAAERTKTARVKAGGTLLSKLVGFEDNPAQLAEFARNHMRLWVVIAPREAESGYLQEFKELARLILVGSGREYESSEYGLEETVFIDLHREP